VFDRVKDGRRQDFVADLARSHARGSQGVGQVRGRLHRRIILPVNDVVDITATETGGTVMVVFYN